MTKYKEIIRLTFHSRRSMVLCLCENNVGKTNIYISQ